jgi:HlyD family secretion protein
VKKKAAMVIVLGAVAIVLLALLRPNEVELAVFHGNVDIRQIELPFAESERIAEVLVEEGDGVKAGQVLARLSIDRLVAQRNQAQAQLAAQEQIALRLANGSRPQEIAQARASLQAAEAEAENARSLLERARQIRDASRGRAVSEQDFERAVAAVRTSEAQVRVQREALQLAIAGSRKEELAQANAQVEAARAALELLERRLYDAELRAPVDAVVRTRLMEPGEFASPQRPVFSLAVTNPKWIRAYVPETALGRLRIGDEAHIRIDSRPQQPLSGTLRFISPVAEFTPKTVQTEELRTSLVYEVRVFVQDEDNQLRLGMPASVQFPKANDEQSL